jgi:hypothetical protein
MATTNITSAATRGSVRIRETQSTNPFYTNSWLNEIRDNSEYNFVPQAVVNTNNPTAITAEFEFDVFNGTVTGVCSRYFMAFDTSAITTSVSSATLYIFRTTTGANNGDFIPVMATAPTTSTNIGGGNYNSIHNYQIGSPMNANVGIGNVIPYANSAPYTLPNAGYNGIPLNAAARLDINLESQIKIALVNYTFDYLYQEIDGGGSYEVGINGQTNPPYLLVETGLGQWVLSINPNSTLKVDSVPRVNIKLVNRLDTIPLATTTTTTTTSTTTAAPTSTTTSAPAQRYLHRIDIENLGLTGKYASYLYPIQNNGSFAPTSGDFVDLYSWDQILVVGSYLYASPTGQDYINGGSYWRQGGGGRVNNVTNPPVYQIGTFGQIEAIYNSVYETTLPSAPTNFTGTKVGTGASRYAVFEWTPSTDNDMIHHYILEYTEFGGFTTRKYGIGYSRVVKNDLTVLTQIYTGGQIPTNGNGKISIQIDNTLWGNHGGAPMYWKVSAVDISGNVSAYSDSYNMGSGIY